MCFAALRTNENEDLRACLKRPTSVQGGSLEGGLRLRLRALSLRLTVRVFSFPEAALMPLGPVVVNRDVQRVQLN